MTNEIEHSGVVALGAGTPEWRCEIKYGPDGEANYAWLYRGDEMIATMRTHHADAIADALTRPAQEPVSVPVGWQLVPIVPTDAMIEASNAISSRAEGKEHWYEMLTAAPQPVINPTHSQVAGTPGLLTETAPADHLRVALEPFAKAANLIEARYGSDLPDGQFQFPELTMGDFRRARAALAASEGSADA